MKKKQCELSKGDVIRVEFGDYDNWVTVVVDKVEDDDNNWSKLTCHYPGTNKPVEMYGWKNDLVEVLDTLDIC